MRKIVQKPLSLQRKINRMRNSRTFVYGRVLLPC